MRVLLDTNLILDALLDRQPWATQARVIWQVAASRAIEGFVTASSLTDIFYVSGQFLRRHPILGLDDRQVVRHCLDELTVTGVDRDTLELAYDLGGRDFEDDLQRACAEHKQLDAILTRDRTGFYGTSVPVYDPEVFVKHLITIGLLPDPGPPPAEGAQSP